MVGVKIDSGPIGLTNDSRNTPREKWPELVQFWRDYIYRDFGYDCRNIVDWLNHAEHMWQALGYKSLDEMVRKGLGIDPADAFLVEEWLKRNRPDQPISLPDALKHALRDTAGNPTGNNQYTEKQRNFDNYQNSSDEQPKRQQSIGGGGTSKDYTAARLRRDDPELYEQVRRGELSANAAAIEAGWRKPQTRYSLPDDPIAAGRYLAQRVDKEWLLAMVDEYMKAIKD